MKTAFFLILFVFGSFQLISQNNFSDIHKLKLKGIKHYNPYEKELSLYKYPKSNIKSSNSVLIGTSGNSYTLIVNATYALDANPALNAIMFTHRAGGAWGGSSGDLRCKISYDLGQTWNDSVVFVNDGTHKYRYPSGIIYNPAGNTTHANAFALVTGPNTNGSVWLSNFFNSKKLDGTSQVNNFVPCLNSKLEYIGLSGGNGTYHTMTDSVDASSGWLVGGLVRHMSFNSTTNGFDVNPNFSYLTRNWKFNFNWNQIFDETGLHGFAYCLGAEQEYDPYNETSLPLVWETFDGGASWTQRYAYGCWHTLSNLTNKIWSTLASTTYSNDSLFWIYRPFFQGGSTKDENYSPGTIDYKGGLHILTTIEGMFSNHPDSLGYHYTNHPLLLFDAYITCNLDEAGQPMWDVQFIDTLKTQVVQDANSPFTDGSDPIGWGHMLNISESSDKKTIFYIWTDTDPDIDSVNSLPEIKCKAINFETMLSTPVINFTPDEGGSYFFIRVPHFVLRNGNDFVIPLTYLNVYETLNPLSPQNLYYMKDLKVNDSLFMIPVYNSTINGPCYYCCDKENNLIKIERNLCSTDIISMKTENGFEISQNFPNPAENNTEIKLILKEISDVEIKLTDLLGQVVFKHRYGKLSEGEHTIEINTENLVQGIYFYTVSANEHTKTKKLIKN